MTDDRIIDSRCLIDELNLLLQDKDDLGEEERERLQAIESLIDDGIPDWYDGATLIREDYFTEYAQELAEDIGAVPREIGWPLYHIDWEAAADALKRDYMTVEFLGQTYYVQADS